MPTRVGIFHWHFRQPAGIADSSGYNAADAGRNRRGGRPAAAWRQHAALTTRTP
jgi:hypothetical protein